MLIHLTGGVKAGDGKGCREREAEKDVTEIGSLFRCPGSGALNQKRNPCLPLERQGPITTSHDPQ